MVFKRNSSSKKLYNTQVVPEKYGTPKTVITNGVYLYGKKNDCNTFGLYVDFEEDNENLIGTIYSQKMATINEETTTTRNSNNIFIINIIGSIIISCCCIALYM